LGDWVSFDVDLLQERGLDFPRKKSGRMMQEY